MTSTLGDADPHGNSTDEATPMPSAFVAPAPPPSQPLPHGVWAEGWSSDAERQAMREERARAEGAEIGRRMADRISPLDLTEPDPIYCGHRWSETIELARLVPSNDGTELRKLTDTVGFSWLCTRDPHEGDDHRAHDSAGKVIAETEPVDPPVEPAATPRKVQRVPVSRPSPKARTTKTAAAS